jgi:hypothetical protein
MPSAFTLQLVVGAVVEDLGFAGLPLDVVACDMGDAGDPKPRRVPA